MNAADIAFCVLFACFTGVALERSLAPYGGFDYKRIARIAVCSLILFPVYCLCLMGAR
jgi:hypothetical protein